MTYTKNNGIPCIVTKNELSNIEISSIQNNDLNNHIETSNKYIDIPFTISPHNQWSLIFKGHKYFTVFKKMIMNIYKKNQFWRYVGIRLWIFMWKNLCWVSQIQKFCYLSKGFTIQIHNI